MAVTRLQRVVTSWGREYWLMSGIGQGMIWFCNPWDVSQEVSVSPPSKRHSHSERVMSPCARWPDKYWSHLSMYPPYKIVMKAKHKPVLVFSLAALMLRKCADVSLSVWDLRCCGAKKADSATTQTQHTLSYARKYRVRSIKAVSWQSPSRLMKWTVLFVTCLDIMGLISQHLK